MSVRSLPLVGVFGLLLAACGGGGGTPAGGGAPLPPGTGAFSCSFVGGGAATMSSGCTNCTDGALQNRSLAADTDLDSGATVDLYHPEDLAAQHAEMVVRVTAQDGVVFPAGSLPGVAMQLPVGENAVYSMVVVTLLDGVQRESQPAGSFSGPSNGDLAYIGFTAPATLTFDAVELRIEETAPWLEEHVYQLIEFCGNGALNE